MLVILARVFVRTREVFDPSAECGYVVCDPPRIYRINSYDFTLERTMPRRDGSVWEITGSDGSEQIFQTKVPCGSITQDQLHALLRALVAKFGLTPREIVGSYLKRGSKGYMAHLNVAKYNSDERKTTDHCCGEGPEFVARVIRAENPPRAVRSNRRLQPTRKARG